MRMNSIRTRLMLSLIVISIFIIFLFGGLELYSADQGIHRDTGMYDLQDSRYLANYVHMYMDNISSDVDVINTHPDTIKAMRYGDLKHIKSIAENLEQYTPSPGVVFVVDHNGSMLYSTKPIDAELLNSFTPYGQAIKNNIKEITDVNYCQALDDYEIAIINPTRDNGTVLGGIVIMIPPSILEDNIQSQIINPNENVILVDRNGSLIAHDSGTFGATDTNFSAYAGVSPVLHGEEGVIMDDHTWDGRHRVLAYHQVPDLGWGVIVSTQESTMDQAIIDEAIMMLGMLVLFIIGLSIIGYFMSDFLTAPIIRLSNTIQKISSGNYRERADIKRSDEIGEMASKFNVMMDELERANKAREDAKEQAELYVDLLGHDINNMNQVALGHIEMTIDAIKQCNCDPSPLEKTRETLAGISMLIDNVMKIRRIKAGEMKLGPVDLDPMIKEVVSTYAPVRGRDIKINYQARCDCRVLGNNLLKDVFANLIGNAIKHSMGPLLIDVELSKTYEQGHEYCIATISDNGPGIPDEKKKSLFGRFMRGAKGTGLGLYLVKSLVENFHGRVMVEDRVPGDYTKGSKFAVLLPVVD